MFDGISRRVVYIHSGDLLNYAHIHVYIVSVDSAVNEYHTRPRVWGRLAKCSDAVGSVSCTMDDT